MVVFRLETTDTLYMVLARLSCVSYTMYLFIYRLGCLFKCSWNDEEHSEHLPQLEEIVLIRLSELAQAMSAKQDADTSSIVLWSQES